MKAKKIQKHKKIKLPLIASKHVHGDVCAYRPTPSNTYNSFLSKRPLIRTHLELSYQTNPHLLHPFTSVLPPSLPRRRTNSTSNFHRIMKRTTPPFTKKHQTLLQNRPTQNPFINNHDFSHLPYDVLLKITATFNLPNIRSASLVCKSWCDALLTLRESMVFLRWGKRFKHGRGGVKRNLSKALDSFLKGAARGSTLAMVDGGLVYWEIGRREEGICLYRKAAELGDPAGQCNLGISLLQVNPPDPEEAVKWLYKASVAGHVRAQYQLALSLHKGHVPKSNLQEAAKWYLRGAEGGYVRAMYNTALCYSDGEGLMQSQELAKKWMKRAADRGHSKAQLEHGLSLFSEGEMIQAVVYLELAARAGEAAADPVKNVILQQMSASSRDHAMLRANMWRALPSSC